MTEPRAPLPTYRHGATNRCPGCGRAAWNVGRTMAECANPRCDVALPLANERNR